MISVEPDTQSLKRVMSSTFFLYKIGPYSDKRGPNVYLLCMIQNKLSQHSITRKKNDLKLTVMQNIIKE